MANCPAYTEFARDLLAREAGEVGMHLHAWNNPPIAPLTADDYRHMPFLIEYPEPQIREKVHVLTNTLEERFGRKMRSHRAGRWSFDEVYARALIDHGYCVDCSVTPHTSWREHLGDPRGRGGTDFRNFPETAYFVDPADLRRAGNSTLLEVPMTIVARRDAAIVRGLRKVAESAAFARRVIQRLFPPTSWLRPNGRNRGALLSILDQAQRERRAYVEFMLHSSEFMPGGSPTFPDDASIEQLYADIEALFAAAAMRFEGQTLSAFHDRFTSGA